MSRKTYTELTNYIDTNINTNGANSIAGAQHNLALNYIVQSMSGDIFDSTRPYKQNTCFLYSDATFGYEVWVVTADIGAGVFPGVKTNTIRITKRSEKITASDTPYTGIESGTHDYSHNLGHTDFTIQAFDSSGAWVPIQINSKSSTKINITVAKNYSDGVILIQEIEIS